VSGENMSNMELKSTRDGFGDALLQLGQKNKKVVVLSANLAESTRVNEFAKKFPERYFEIGVAEQNLTGIAAGFAMSDKIPYMTSFAAFSPSTNWSQIRTSICYNNANVKIISTHAGLSAGADGASHQALEDIALMRVLPNMIVINPADYNEAFQATLAISKINHPVYLRLGREPFPIITANTEFQIGKISILQEGQDVTLISTGNMLFETLKAAEQLKSENISAAVLNCPSVKPLDENTILEYAQRTEAIITIEEHQKSGGLGSAVAELLSQKFPTAMAIIGVDDQFGQSGKPQELFEKYGLTAENIIKNTKALIKNKTKEKICLSL
jgi:transketolase